MKFKYLPNSICAALVTRLAMSGYATQVLAQDSRYDQLANAPFPGGYPAKETAAPLKNECSSSKPRRAISGRFPPSICGR